MLFSCPLWVLVFHGTRKAHQQEECRMYRRLMGRLILSIGIGLGALTILHPAAADPFPIDEQINVTPDWGVEVIAPEVAYDREAAASWALAHAQDRQSFSYSGCAWFVSQALWYGGLPENDQWHGDGIRGPRRVPGTATATVAPMLVQHLVDKGYATVIPLYQDRFAQNAIPEAQVGDVIAYDWEGSGGIDLPAIDHLSIITNITAGGYPEVSEWGTASSSNLYRSTYSKRGWTWSANSKDWLQATEPKVIAYLVQFSL